MKSFCSVIIVTYNSQLHIAKAMDCIQRQTRPFDQIILVDTGSKDRSYLDAFRRDKRVSILFGEYESGFCRGNNLGYSAVSDECDFVFLLNPDAFLSETFLEHAVAYMEMPDNSDVGAITGVTLGYDIHRDCPTGKADTTGIFTTWYGRWFDRDQGKIISSSSYTTPEPIPAICGAVFFCRKTALDRVLVRGKEVLDSSFYMYKEDIDLSLRFRKAGWKLMFVPSLVVYHCRGWNPDRKKIPRRYRLCSAVNEWRLHVRSGNPFALAYSGIKYCAVKFLDW